MKRDIKPAASPKAGNVVTRSGESEMFTQTSGGGEW